MSWVLNDSAPVTLGQEFAAPPPEKAWGWFGLPFAGEGSVFDAESSPWAEHDWLSLLGFLAAASQGGSSAVAIVAVLLQRFRNG